MTRKGRAPEADDAPVILTRGDLTLLRNILRDYLHVAWDIEGEDWATMLAHNPDRPASWPEHSPRQTWIDRQLDNVETLGAAGLRRPRAKQQREQDESAAA
ncbi:MAG: hypothetical protein AVDCRST_MAG77-2654 [uncultured Chloroflexi bacterium]|uniref:Uncharacterized protein n=1 Tax=uncultured Chloroflexota bacterium TaxID=166587 RepID=A0A6J4IWF8_9CHLR|nr:MAG: hypothetical protein AVDCRST_MAG77-2654 [uncultured Chloroflexota bacterium]